MKVYPFRARRDGERVLSLKRVKGGVRIREECDKYFSVVLDKSQLEIFIGQLRAVADAPEPETPDVAGH